MGDRMKEMREKSKKMKHLLAQAYGVGGPGGLRDVLAGKGDKRTSTSPGASRTSKAASNTSEAVEVHLEDKEELYTDSSTFLKGLQSANPHNDYNQNFVDIGERPQNYIRDTGLANRFEEYPKQRELMRLKDELVCNTNAPPMYLQCDLETYDLRDLKNEFDVILVEPPLEEYQRSSGVVYDKYWDWDENELDVILVEPPPLVEPPLVEPPIVEPPLVEPPTPRGATPRGAPPPPPRGATPRPQPPLVEPPIPRGAAPSHPRPQPSLVEPPTPHGATPALSHPL